MAHRGQESPMDFQYDGPVHRGQESPMDFQFGGPGPVDPNSPFIRMASLSQETPKKRPHSIFQSSTPSKLPTLTPPTSQPFLFAKTPYQTPHSTRPPPPIFRTPSTTLKKPAFDMSELSNDPDIFSTPAAARTENLESTGDTEITPETSRTPYRGSKPVIFSATTPGRITGRGEIPRGRYHDGAITKVRRRRQFRLPSTTRATDSDSDSDLDYDPSEHAPTSPSWKFTASNWVSTHRDIPLIASQYLQLLFNLSLILLLLYALFCFYLTIRHDVDKKVSEFSATILAEMSLCSRNYVENRCAPDMRVPAMEIACGRWEKCMNRDPTQVGRARVSAETFAEIINSFIEPISYKTMFFCLLTVFGGIFFSNFAFGFYRAKALNHPAPYLAAAAPPIANRLEQMHPEEYQHVPSTPRPSTPVRSTPARNTGYRTPATGTKRAAIGWRE